MSNNGPSTLELSPIEGWLAEREQIDRMTVVELGHSNTPIALNQVFDGQRYYIGVESWDNKAHSAGGRYGVEAARKKGGNIVFLEIKSGRTGFNGETYNPESWLPGAIADEVYMGDVFGDPIISNYPERTQSLATEATRLLQVDGRLVIREASTPGYSHMDLVSKTVCLELEGNIKPGDSQFPIMEELYAPEITDRYPGPKEPRDGIFYAVYKKVSAPEPV